MLQQSFKAQIRALCDERGWEFQDLAKKMKVTQTGLSHMLGREESISPPKIAAIARALGTEPWAIDLYCIKMLPQVARSAPALISICRSLLKAADASPREFQKVQNRLEDAA